MLADSGQRSVSAERPLLVLTTLALTVGLMALLFTAVAPVRTVVVELDARWLAAAVEYERAGAVLIAEVFAVLGGVYVTFPLRVAVSLFFVVRRQWWKLSAWLLAIAATELVTTALKVAYARQRPAVTLELAGSFAFPSGHASAAAVTATTLVLLCTRPGPSRRRWTMVAVVVVALMAASRVYLRVHWLSDVLMGSLVGAAMGLLAVGVTAVLAERRRRSRAIVAHHQGPSVDGAGSAS